MKWRSLAAVAAATMALGGTAHAQSLGDLGNYGFSARLGVLWPTESDLKAMSKNLLGIGLDYRLDRSFFKDGVTFISGDWITQHINGRLGSWLAFNLNQRVYLKGDKEAQRPYFVAGAGFSIVDITGGSQTVFGGRFGVGMEVSSNVYIEGMIYLSDKRNGNMVRANAAGIFVGYKF